MAEQDNLRNNIRNDIRNTTTIPFSFKTFVSGVGLAISRAGTRTWDKLADMPDELRDGFSKVSSTIQSSTTEIMGSALNSMLGDIKSLASGIKDITTGTFKKLFSFFGSDEDESLDEEKKQTKTLGNIFKIFKKWSIRDMFKAKEKKADDGGFFTPLAILGLALGAITGGIAASIGGVIEYFLIPFKVVLNSLRGVTTLLKESSIGKLFVDFFGKVRTFFGGWIDDAVISITNFFSKFKIFAGFFKGFGVGFMKLFSKIPVIGWFITGVMAVIDFFTGFFGTEGSFFEKIKAGVLKMTTGFFDPVFEFVGWITDWVLGLFGIDSNVGQTLKTGFSDLLNFIFDIFTTHIPNIFGSVWNSIVEIKDWVLNYPIKDKFLEAWEWIKTSTDNLVESIKTWLVNLIPSFDDIKEMLPSFDSIKNSIIGARANIREVAGNALDSAGEYVGSIFSKGDASPSVAVNDLDSSNKAKEISNNKELVKAIHKNSEQMIKESKKRDEEKKDVVNQQVNVSSVQNSRGSSGGSFIEAPDEIENFGIVFMNKTTLGGTF